MNHKDFKPNQKINSFTLLSVDSGRAVRGRDGCYWKCICDCGKKISVKDIDLADETHKKCSRKCPAVPDFRQEIVGEVYGDFKIVSFAEIRAGGKAYYNIICLRCGMRYVKRGASLVSGVSVNCGVCEPKSSRRIQ